MDVTHSRGRQGSEPTQQHITSKTDTESLFSQSQSDNRRHLHRDWVSLESLGEERAIISYGSIMASLCLQGPLTAAESGLRQICGDMKREAVCRLQRFNNAPLTHDWMVWRHSGNQIERHPGLGGA